MPPLHESSFIANDDVDDIWFSPISTWILQQPSRMSSATGDFQPSPEDSDTHVISREIWTY